MHCAIYFVYYKTMKHINLVIFLLFGVIVSIYKVECKICTKREVFTTRAQEFQTYTTFYNRPCRLNDVDTECNRPLKIIARRPITVTKRIVKSVQYCCDGYMRTDSGSDSEGLECQPLCVPNCLNGRCDSPGQCNCNTGFTKDPKNQHQCVPTCIDGCEHGICMQPNVCECNSGYENINGTCSPICSEPCYNGTCVAPDICDCLVGYRKSEENTCEPYCYSGCEHGSCVAPETCSCDEGWFLTADSKCASFCGQACIGRKCVPRYNCECLPGYELDEGGNCNPICKNCQGSCVAPYICECDVPFVGINYAADDTSCDCFLNCTDEDVECEGTVCLETATSMQTIIDDEATEPNSYEEVTINDIVPSTNISIKDSYTNTSRFEYDWTIIIVSLGLGILLIVLCYLVVSRWKYLVIYFKGSSYVVEDARDVHQSSQFVDVPLSDKTARDISKKDRTNDCYITTA